MHSDTIPTQRYLGIRNEVLAKLVRRAHVIVAPQDGQPVARVWSKQGEDAEMLVEFPAEVAWRMERAGLIKSSAMTYHMGHRFERFDVTAEGRAKRDEIKNRRRDGRAIRLAALRRARSAR